MVDTDKQSHHQSSMDLKSHQRPKKTVIIAGGGTGGHIYPGVAIARTLEKLHPEIEVHFVGARGGLEEKIIPREKFPLHLVSIGKLHKSVGLLTRLKTLVQMPLALLTSLKILRTLKPEAVLGVGGFASGPLLFAAALSGRRALIWEPNAYPGLANRLLSRFASECLLVFQEAAKYLHTKKVTQSGLPVRSTMHPTKRPEGLPLRILVFGGSQGARFINNVVSDAVLDGGDWLKGVELVHQTGALDFPRISELYRKAPSNVQVFEYLHDMDQRLAWADIVVCRSGASTVAEICACQKAAVFIPLPTAADNHQQKNAEVLVRENAAMMALQSELTSQKFMDLMRNFRDNRDLIKELEKNVQRFQFPNAAEKIVERILDTN